MTCGVDGVAAAPGRVACQEDDETDLTLWLLVAAVIVNGMLVGASLDQSIKQLPAHSLATTRAAPTNFSQRSAAGDAARLKAIFDRFERLQTARATLQVLTLLSVAWALTAVVHARFNA